MKPIALIAVLLGGCTVTVLAPPAEFAKPLTNQRVLYVTEKEALRVCPKHPSNTTSLVACTDPSARPCEIIIGVPDGGLDPALANALVHHELAHCPDARGRYWVHH
jgi:hypothetical protein